MDSTFIGETDFIDLIQNGQRQSTIIFATDEDIDLFTIRETNGVTTRRIKSENSDTEYQYTIPVSTIFPTGATITARTSIGSSSIIKVVARSFSSKRAFLDFLENMFSVDLENLDLLWVCSEGYLGNILHPFEERMFNGLFQPEHDFDRNLN